MLALIETLTGFAAIMLMLSLLVKTLTSVIKNQWDYYSDNAGAPQLVSERTGRECTDKRPGVPPQDPHGQREVHVSNANEESSDGGGCGFVPVVQHQCVYDLEIAVHGSAIARREKDRQTCREKAAETRRIDRGVRNSERMAKVDKLADGPAKVQERQKAIDEWNAEEKPALEEEKIKLAQEKRDTQNGQGILLYEFFGSLLTGILVSIGAPYWHDILQALSSLRSTPAAAKAKV
jgi:hypothetical protein